MGRRLWPMERVHPAVRETVERRFEGTIAEVEAAIAAHQVVVIGMGLNPHPLRARRMLGAAGIEHHYLSYGSYLSQWRRRTALKMWIGWHTFPMVFVRGDFIGGANDLQRLLASGELSASSPR